MHVGMNDPWSWPPQVHWVPSTDSTNRLALDLAREGIGLPIVVGADAQIAGRGRHHRTWYADEGTLTVTYAFTVSQLAQVAGASAGTNVIPIDGRLAMLSLVAGVATGEAIEQQIGPIRASLKWPNDVQVLGKKVAGILVESHRLMRGFGTTQSEVVGSADAQSLVLIGIGVNVATQFERAPLEVQHRAVSMASAAGRPIDRREFLPVLTDRLGEWLLQWAQCPEHVVDAFVPRCCLSGRAVRIAASDRAVQGVCEGIDRLGRLLVRDPQGGLQAIASGEVTKVD
jgi:BirA family transcriptional regulator, biotin operon repressor / biotin---[acetyl-CoA-carboxylase] ligase